MNFKEYRELVEQELINNGALAYVDCMCWTNKKQAELFRRDIIVSCFNRNDHAKVPAEMFLETVREIISLN